MIKTASWPHSQGEARPKVEREMDTSIAGRRRLAEMFDEHYDVVWRSLRRFGVAPDEVDDAAQEVFIVAARRLDDIEVKKERSFLFSTAVRVASDARRARARRGRVGGDDDAIDVHDPTPGADVLTDQMRARAMLDEVLEGMTEEQRVVFVLFELEGMTMAAIAEDLDLPSGTVASRLRRGREHYQRQVERLRATVQRKEAQ